MTLEPAFPLAWPAGYSRTLAGLRRESAFRVTTAAAYRARARELHDLGDQAQLQELNVARDEAMKAVAP